VPSSTDSGRTPAGAHWNSDREEHDMESHFFLALLEVVLVVLAGGAFSAGV
jgi:hypothetical protein